MFRLEGFTLTALVFFSLFGLLLLAVSLLNGQSFTYRIREYITQGLRLVGSVLVGLPMGLIQAAQTSRETKRSEPGSGSRRAGAVLRGILIALPLVGLLGLLLASADAVFSSRFSVLLDWIKLDKPEELVMRFLFVLGLSYALFGFVWHALTKTGEKLPLEPDQPLVKPFLGMTESTIILTALNVLFAAFVLVQMKYFFAGAQNINLAGFTYAEYARRGFLSWWLPPSLRFARLSSYPTRGPRTEDALMPCQFALPKPALCWFRFSLPALRSRHGLPNPA